MHISQIKQILEQYFLLLNGKRAMTDNLDMDGKYIRDVERIYFRGRGDVEQSLIRDLRSVGLTGIMIRNAADTTYADVYLDTIHPDDFKWRKLLATFRSRDFNGASVEFLNYHNDAYRSVAIMDDDFLSILRGGDITILANKVFKPNLPVADPTNAGQLWNDAGTVKVSTG